MSLRSRITTIAAQIRADERGGSLVEMAVVLPIAMVVLTGLLQFGVYINQCLELQNGTSLAAQNLAISRGVTTDPCNLTVSSFQAVSPFLNSSNATFSFVFTTPTGTVGNYPNTTSCTGGVADMTQGGTAQVTVNYPCSLAIFGKNFAPVCSIQAQVTEVIQ
jgi:Flp pilus assembly protein TadG